MCSTGSRWLIYLSLLWSECRKRGKKYDPGLDALNSRRWPKTQTFDGIEQGQGMKGCKTATDGAATSPD